MYKNKSIIIEIETISQDTLIKHTSIDIINQVQINGLLELLNINFEELSNKEDLDSKKKILIRRYLIYIK